MRTDNNSDNGDAVSEESAYRNTGGLGGTSSPVKKTIKRVAAATLLVSGFSIFTGLVANTFRPAEAVDDSAVATVAVPVSQGSLSITLGTSAQCSNFNESTNTLTLENRAGALTADCITVSVFTDSDFGYNLTINGPADGNLRTTDNLIISPTEGTKLAPTALAPTATSGQWGFAIPNNQVEGHTFGFDTSYAVLANVPSSTARFAAVPTSASIFSTTTTGNTAGNPNTYDIFFAVATGNMMASGEYSGQVTISGTMNTMPIPEPTITAINPNTGSVAGGTSVTITGTNFMVDDMSLVDAVSIGVYTCTNINVASATSLTCTTSAGTVGVQTVTVDTQGGTATLPNGFTYTSAIAQPGDFMQNITLANCPTTRTRVVDARDGNTYWIQRVGDLCWMDTNLAYRGGGTNTFGDVMNLVTTPAGSAAARRGTIMAGTTGPGAIIAGVTGTGQVCHGNNASMNTHGQPCFWEPAGSNITSGTTNPSTSTTGVGQYGVLYNWCAAMGGQPEACQTGAASQPYQGVNPGGNTINNICPRGWRLPTGEPTTGEFTVLNNLPTAQGGGGGVTANPNNLLAQRLFQYSGVFNDGGFASQGTAGLGHYWSSSVDTTTNARNLGFVASAVLPAYTTNKGNGFAVRCVAP